MMRAVLPILILLVAGSGMALLAATRPDVQPAEQVERVWPVAVTTVALTDVRPTLSLYGEVIADGAAEIRSGVAGDIVAMGDQFRDGGRVRSGDLLAQLDDFDLRQSLLAVEAQLAEARARRAELEARLAAARENLASDRDLLAIAEREMVRAETLSARGTVSSQALDDARRSLVAARQQVAARENTVIAEAAMVDQQQARIDQLVAQVAQAGRDVDRTLITAPADGFVLDATAEIGQRLSVGERIATLIDPTRLVVRAQMSETQYGRLIDDGLVGQPATVIWTVGTTEMQFDAQVDRVDGSIDPTTGGIAVFATIDGLTLDTPLRQGAFVAVEMPDRRYDNVASVPRSAVDSSFVLAVNTDGRVERRAVTVVGRNGEDLLISHGLMDGDRVVVSRFSELRPGAAVSIEAAN